MPVCDLAGVHTRGKIVGLKPGSYSEPLKWGNQPGARSTNQTLSSTETDRVVRFSNGRVGINSGRGWYRGAGHFMTLSTLFRMRIAVSGNWLLGSLF